jgi:hypothetical protein
VDGESPLTQLPEWFQIHGHWQSRRQDLDPDTDIRIPTIDAVGRNWHVF